MIENKEVLKRTALKSMNFLSPQIENMKENKQKLLNLSKVGKLFPIKQSQSQSQNNQPKQNEQNQLAKIRSNSPLCKISEQGRNWQSMAPVGQNFFQSKLRSILHKNLWVKTQGSEGNSSSIKEVAKPILSGKPAAPKRVPPHKAHLRLTEQGLGSQKRIDFSNTIKMLEKTPTTATDNPRYKAPGRLSSSTSVQSHLRQRETVPIFKTKETSEDSHSLMFESQAKLALMGVRDSVQILIAIKQTILNDEESANEVQNFLEHSKFTNELEASFRNALHPTAQTFLLLPKISLLLVLFALNFVELKAYKNNALAAIDSCLESYLFGLQILKEAISDPSIQEIADECMSELTAACGAKHINKDGLKSLRGSLRLARTKLVELSFLLYRSQELCVRLESLALESEKLTIEESYNRAFSLFEAVLKGSCGEAPCEPESIDPSFSYDPEDPNFILQPLKSEKYLPVRVSQLPLLTLVLDLDETLVHFEESKDGGEFLVRPHATEFLEAMHRHFELVIFTAAVKDYADWILDRIDPDRRISHRLYRQHTQPQNGVYVKDLSRLGRDLARVIIIDNNAENFQLQPENGIYIKTWHDDPNDNALPQLIKVLTVVAQQCTGDVRVFLKEMQARQMKKVK